MTEDQILSKMGFVEPSKTTNPSGDSSQLPKVTIEPTPLKQLLPWEEFGGSMPTPAFNKHVVTLQKVKLTRAEREKLRALDERIDKLRARKDTFGIDRADRRIQELRDAAESQAINGEGQELPRLVDYPEVYEEYQRARYAIEQEIKKVYTEALPILQGIAKRVEEAYEPLADSLQGDELSVHAKMDGLFGFEYIPGKSVVTLRQPWRVPQLVPEFSRDISKICDALGFDLWEE